jgi:hypothetical protein
MMIGGMGMAIWGMGMGMVKYMMIGMMGFIK